MTSQKRYRHHQENSNNRYRDLPPRFKRQKSSSSPTPTSTESQPSQVSVTAKHSSSDKSTKKAELCEPAMSPVHISSPVVFVEGYGNQDRVRADIFHTPQPMGSSVPWCWSPSRSENGSVLSDGDNRLSQSQSPVAHVSLGTHFGYRTTSPPVSPWNVGILPTTASHVPSATTWSHTPQTDPFRSQNLLSPPGFSNNENRAPQGLSQINPGSQWSRPTFSPLQNQNLPPTPRAVVGQGHASPSLPRKSSESPKMSPVKKTDTKRDVDYSDPDIRTIEMLRELERVADQKESEGDDFGADRKSLVSHHLRMLMCAVDRYTEGIEDEVPTSRADEVSQATDSPRPTPVVSPAPSKSWPAEDTRQAAATEASTGIWSTNVSSPEWARGPAMSPNVCSPEQFSSPSPVISSPSPQTSPSWNNDSIWTRTEVPGWDLWSSPSFDFCGVLTRQGFN